ncbi:MAG: RNA polymerase factor sigma-54 [Candidatus Riflebacteria bacterium]|nr:RNA polymerase factor sigma-54 [Candidatus Riflebacteria bacterium]
MDNSLRIRQDQRLVQTLKMTPEMQLAIKILQLNSIELKSKIEEVLETNPIVEIDEKLSQSIEVPFEKKDLTASSEVVPASKDFKEQLRDDFGVDWQKYIQDTENSEYRVTPGSYSGDEETNYENFVSKRGNLRDHLNAQLPELGLNSTELKIGEYIIGLIDRNGYIRHSRESITEMLKIDSAVVNKVVNALQQMDPVGICAFDLRECLLLQAREENYDDIVITIIDKHLDEIAHNKLHIIAKETGYDIEDVSAAVEIIKQLNPKPGSTFASPNEEIYVVPDVFIEKIDGEYKVTLNEKGVPQLRINSIYLEAIKNKDKDKEDKTYEYVREKLEEARSFLKYIDKRKSTILSVTSAIVEVQRDFFEFGVRHLKPLTLVDVGAMAGVHESTVSRSTSGKYAQTPRGLLELKFFFSGGAKTLSGEDISTFSLKKRIEDLVKFESPEKPLSDSDIEKILKSEGISLARRTIAKYRTELNIPSSSARKKV